MGDFSTEWLRLREPVDRRSRSATVAEAVRRAFLGVRAVRVVDIGCGTGANLRATAPLLGGDQDWILLDNDPALLGAAPGILGAWADEVRQGPDGLVMRKDGKTIRVRFQHADLSADPGGALVSGPHLVTASAFFDLVSAAFIDRFVSVVVHRQAAFHTVLTYDGIQDWAPASAFDERVCQAFNAHQTGDKGFGPATGPGAPALLRRAFDAVGYVTAVGDSPWVLGPDDRDLMDQLAEGIASAVVEAGALTADGIAAWRGVRRDAARVGHEDILALPAGWPIGAA